MGLVDPSNALSLLSHVWRGAGKPGFPDYHALVDGNKRLAWSAGRVFHLTNERDLTYTVDEAEQMMLSAAVGEIDVPDIGTWLRRHTAPQM